MGSETVKINGLRAARVGDYLQGSGPPNRIATGSPNVSIGSPGIGSADAAGEATFCRLYCALAADWPRLTPRVREERYEAMLGEMFGRFGAPPPTAEANIRSEQAAASWDARNWQVNVQRGAWSAAAPPSRDGTLHEIRHGEQVYAAVRANGGAGVGSVHPEALRAAARRPLDPNTAEGRFGRLHADNQLREPGRSNFQGIINQIYATPVRDPRYRAVVQAYYDQPGGADALDIEAQSSCGGCR